MQVIGNPKWVVSKTILMLLLGILVASFFVDPLVNVVDNFAIATRIPSFFISFFILPFVRCSDVVLALLLVNRKKPSVVGELTFFEVCISRAILVCSYTYFCFSCRSFFVKNF